MLEKVVIPMFVSPVVAFSLGFALMVAIMWIFRNANPGRANRGFKVAQTVSAAAMALGHGLQDAQKTMGVIFLALLTGGYVAAPTTRSRSGSSSPRPTAISAGT